MNNYEEFVGFVLCPSKAQIHWRPLFENIRDCIAETGHAPMKAIYTDNPVQDKRICESVFTSLKLGVVDRQDVEFGELPSFRCEDGITTEFCRAFERIQSFVADILSDYNEPNRVGPFHVHLDAEWNFEIGRPSGKVAVIQMGYLKRIGVFLVND
jgi:hypothetical protein